MLLMFNLYFMQIVPDVILVQIGLHFYCK